MISRQEHNELIRKAGRERLRSIRDRYYKSEANFYDPLGSIHRPLSDEEKQNIREGLKARSRISRRWTLIVFSLATLVVGFLCYKILLSLSYL
jgi:hypothetical protein